MSTPPGILQFKREDFPSSGLTTLDALDKLFLPLNRWLDQARIALTHGIDLTNNTLWELKAIKVVTPATDWVAPASLAGGWVNFAGNPNALYRKGPDGRVDVIGVLSNPSATPTVNTDIFIMPTAYIPDIGTGAAGHHLYAATTQTAGGDGFVSMDVHNNGGLRYRSGYSQANGYLAIDTSYMAADRTPVPLSCFPVDFTLQRVQSPSGLLLIGCRDITTPGNGGPSSDPPAALGTPKWTLLQSNKVRLQNLSGLLPGRAYQLTFLALK